MMPAQTVTQWEFSEAFTTLCDRKRMLSAYIIEGEEDKVALSLMWDALADDFDAQGYKVNAGMCRQKAAYWGRLIRPAVPTTNPTKGTER